jgi:hypothetical protein
MTTYLKVVLVGVCSRLSIVAVEGVEDAVRQRMRLYADRILDVAEETTSETYKLLSEKFSSESSEEFETGSDVTVKCM